MLDVYYLTLNNSLSKQYCLTMVYSQIYNYDLIKGNYTCFFIL